MDRLRRGNSIAAGGLVTSVACPGLILPARAVAPFKETITTLFWVGEASGKENAFIPNDQSYWDQNWQDHYGGVDDPERRSGHWPADFKPKENPVYVALPYGEFTQAGKLKRRARDIPWFTDGVSPLLKNRWVEIVLRSRSCFAQWQDVGPAERTISALSSATRPSRGTRSMPGPGSMCLRRVALPRHGRQPCHGLALR